MACPHRPGSGSAARIPAPCRRDPTQHRLHYGRRPRQRRSRLPRQRYQDAQHRQARPGRRAPGILLRRAGLHPLARRADDRPLPHALRPADPGHLPQPHLRPAHRRAHAAPGPEGSRLRHLHGRQMASRPRRPQILAAEPRLRLFLRQRHGRDRLFLARARRRDRLAAQRQVLQGRRLLHRTHRQRRRRRDQEARRQETLLPLFRLACPARAVPGHRPAEGDVSQHRGQEPPVLCRHDHRPR